jgi:hypothetical protein
MPQINASVKNKAQFSQKHSQWEKMGAFLRQQREIGQGYAGSWPLPGTHGTVMMAVWLGATG